MPRRNTIEVVITGKDAGATRTIDSVNRVLGKFDSAADSARVSASGFGSVLKTALGTAIGFTVAGVFQTATHAVRNFIETSISAAAQMERFNVQFEVLLGSAEAATQRLDEIKEFARVTPFNLDDVVEANKVLTVFGRGVLDTTEVMTKVGDAAAFAGVRFNDLAVWVGRAYSSIQAGRPFGEAAMRLQELGILTGEARTELERMTESGARAEDIWGFLVGQLDKFGGLMDKQSNTFEGLVSNLEDTWFQIQTIIGQPIMEAAKTGLLKLLDALSDPETQQGIADLAAGLGELTVAIIEFLSKAGEASTPVSAGQDFGKMLQGLARDIPATVQGFNDIAVTALNTWAELLFGTSKYINETTARMTTGTENILYGVGAVNGELVRLNDKVITTTSLTKQLGDQMGIAKFQATTFRDVSVQLASGIQQTGFQANKATKRLAGMTKALQEATIAASAYYTAGQMVSVQANKFRTPTKTLIGGTTGAAMQAGGGIGAGAAAATQNFAGAVEWGTTEALQSTAVPVWTEIRNAVEEAARAQVSQLNDQMRLLDLMDPEGKLTDLRDTFERQLRAAQINELLASNNSLQALQVQIQQELLRVNQEEASLQRQQAKALTEALRPRPAPSLQMASGRSSRRRLGIMPGSDGEWVTGGGEPVPAYILNVHSMARTEDVEADFELLRAKAGRR
ncbi:MAG: tape measure protein [Thiomonas arsenitoxydans]|nr:tape measure protein [Thiomonas arsenitoxydans]